MDQNEITINDNYNNKLEILSEEIKEEKTENLQPVVSKRQLKKLAKRKKWEERKHVLRAAERQKQKLKKQKLREEIEKEGLEPPKKLRKLMKESECKLRLAIDLSFDDLMSFLDINRVLKQLQRCYAINRRSERPLQFYLTSFNGQSKEIMASKEGCLNWDVHYEDGHYADIFKKEDIVYLTSDSPNVIEKLDDSKVYIIGGLVDHNHQKGLCYDLALKKQVGHGKLPLGKYLDMKTRHVLTVNQVFEIILQVSSGKSWEESLLDTLPMRKGAKPIKEESQNEVVPENAIDSV